MAYTLTQLEAFFKNANAGTAATAAQITGLQGIANQNATGVLTDAQALQSTISLAANVTTEVSVQTYQFFTGTAPSEAGLAALNAAYVGSGAQSGLNGENRYIAQSVSLALQNATAKANFAATYGSLSIADATKAAYNVIVGNTAAAAAGINVDNAVAFLSSAASVAYYTAFVRANAGLGANPSAADVDLAVKAALVGSIIYNATVFNNGAGVGSYATATNNLIRDLADDGKLTQNNAAGINLFTAYPVGAGAGSTIALATTIDTLSGTSGNDTFQAVLNSSDITKNTLNAADNLTGGDGVDTLQISASGAGAAAVSGVTLNSIENIAVTNGAAGVVTFDGSLSTGVTGVSVIGSTSGVTFNNLKAIPTISLVGNAGDVTVGLAAAATAGLADTAAVTLNSSYTTNSGTLTVNGIESLTVNTTGATGSATTSLTIADDSLQSLAITGAGGASLVANLVGAAGTITGVVTSAEGADTVAVTAGASGKLSVNMGAGNDTVSLSTVAATYTVAGGDGTDTLVYTGTTAVAAAATANVTGFETVRLTGAASFNLAAANVTYTTTAAGTYTGLTAATAGATVNAEAGGTVTLAASATASEYTGTADAVTVNVGKATTAGALSATVSTSGIETVTVNNLSLGTDVTSARTITVSDAKMKTLAVSGGAQPTTVSGGGAALTSVNTTGVTGNVTFNGTVATTGATITAGGGNDNLTGGAGNDTIIGGAGNDTISGGAGVDSLSGGDGADVFVIAANTALVTNSTAAAPKVIDDFKTGIDKLQLAQGPVAFLGNFANIQQALAAAQAGGVANQAAYVTGENNLYVFTNTNNTLNVLDTVVKLNNVATLAATDLFLGTQGTTGGAAITLNATNASVGLTGALVGATANAGTTVVNTTVFDDVISSTVANLAGATLTGGAGLDTITLTGTAGGTVAANANITGFEVININNATAEVVFNVAAANVADGTVLSINASGNAGVDGNATPLASAVKVLAGNVAATGRVSITGGAGVDSLVGGAGNDTINAGAGADVLTGNAGADVLNGNDGNDTVTGGDGNDVIDGGAGDDDLAGGADNDTVNGGDGNDTITGDAGNNVLNGGAGLDTITAGSATDTIDGGAGTDTIILTGVTYTGSFTGGASDIDTLRSANNANIAGATIATIERLDFNQQAHNVTMTVAQHETLAVVGIGPNTTQSITLSAAGAITGKAEDAGDDMTYVLANGAGNVFTAATTATDYKVTGGDTATTYKFGATLTANDTITGTAGNDTLELTGGATGSGNITAIETFKVTATSAVTFTTGAIVGAATSTIDLSTSTQAVTLDASGFVGSATSLTIIDGAGNDVITIPNADDAARAKTTVTLSTGGADTINLQNAGHTAATATAATINNFTQAVGAGQDKIGGLSLTSYQTVTAAAATGVVASAVVEIETSVGNTATFDATDGGNAETLIANALGTFAANGGTFYTLVYGTGANAGKTGLYQVTTTANNQDIVTGNITVELVGIFNGTTDNGFVASNFGF